MEIRAYDHSRDLEAVQRIWREIGWVSSDEETDQLQHFLPSGRGLVFDIDGEAESLAHATSGLMRYQGEDLRLSAVTAVTTSRIARKLGFAKRLTARLLADEAAGGAEISALGMFEQGFYDQVGFGSGGYEHWLIFDPATLTVDRPFRVPKRLGIDDWRLMHAAMMSRMRGHGGCVLDPPEMFKAECRWVEHPFGLGYCDGPQGELTHFFLAGGKEEYGPYTIKFIAYRNHDQLLELLALIRSLGDQISSIEMLELSDVQMQDLLRHPLRQRRNTEEGKHENSSSAMAVWQFRILDLAACLAKTRLPAGPLRFNLELTDPVDEHLDDDSPWRGLGGRYVVTLGPESSAAAGEEPDLETLTASVGAFSRLWFGVQPASSLALTDSIDASPALLAELDRVVRLPKANLGWDF